MTVEELEIIVEASIEPALKEIKKLMPEIKKQVTQAVEVAQQSMEKVDMKKVTNKVQKAVNFIKNKIDKLKKTNQNNEIAIKVNNKEAQKQITQLEKQINSLQKQIEARKMKLSLSYEKSGAIEEGYQSKRPDGVSKNDERWNLQMDSYLQNDKSYNSLMREQESLEQEIIEYNNKLSEAKTKVSQLKQELSQTGASQNKLTSFFNIFKGKIDGAKTSITGMKKSLSQMPKITQKITNNIKNMGTGFKTGIKHVFKYAMALFSLRGIYSVLSNSASSWLSSQNTGAKQLSANIEYMKYAMGSVFAPIIQHVINLVYSLMKALQSVVYAFSGINIFAKATASSMNKTASGANKASKSLSGVHGEINNVSENNNSGSGNGSSPSMDLSEVDTQMNSFSQKLYNFFKPLIDSWNMYGGGLIEQIKVTVDQVGGLISSVWGSFENLITNGTVYSILENILVIIGNIAEAFANAWNNNGNGDAIIQNLANALNNLLGIIEKITQSTVFQWILDVGVSAIEKLTEAVEWVTQKVNEFVDFLTGSENDLDLWAVLIGSITTAVLLLVTAIGAYNAITAIMGVVTTIATSPITLIVLAITALIAIIVLCVKHWDTIKETVLKVCNKIKEVAVNVWNKIKDTISTVVTTVKDKVSTAFTNIKDKITTIMTNIKTKLGEIWDGIWSTIKGVINLIIGGVEKMCNMVIRGINKILTPLTKVGNTILEAVGIKSFSFKTIAEIALPRLATGNVAYSETVAVFGEYVGARNNPEITTPQNIMRETFEDVLANREWNNSNNFTGELKQLIIQFGSTRVALEIEKLLLQARRQNGTATVTI